MTSSGGPGEKRVPKKKCTKQHSTEGAGELETKMGALRTLASTVMGIIVYDEYSPADKIHGVSMRKASSSLRVPHRHSPSDSEHLGWQCWFTLCPWTTLLQPSWAPCCSLNARQVQPQGLCICGCLCLEHFLNTSSSPLSCYSSVIFSVKPSLTIEIATALPALSGSFPT